jgi:hypothetical protein
MTHRGISQISPHALTQQQQPTPPNTNQHHPVHNRTHCLSESSSPQAKRQPPKKQGQPAKAKIQPKKQGTRTKAKTQPPKKQGKRQRDSGQNNQSSSLPVKKSKPTMDNIPTGCMDGGFNNSGGYRQWSQKQQQQQIDQQQHQQDTKSPSAGYQKYAEKNAAWTKQDTNQVLRKLVENCQWHCAACTFANEDMSALACSICTTPREQNNQMVGNGPPQSGVFDLTSDGPAEREELLEQHFEEDRETVPSDDQFDDRFNPEKELYVLTSTFETQ